MDEKTLRSYRSLLHPLLALAVPFSFLLALDGLARSLALSALVPAAMPGFPLLLLAAGASEVLTGNRLAARKVTGFLPRLRELLIVLIAAWAIQVAFVGVAPSLVSRLADLGVIYGTILALSQWLMTYAIHAALREREFLYAQALGKRGTELTNLVREFFDETRSAVDAVRRVQRSLVVLQVVIFVLLAVDLAAGTPVTPLLLALAIGHEVVAFLAYAVLNQFLEEQEMLGDGIAVSPSLRRRRLGALLAVFVAGTLLALLATGRRSLFPSSLLADIVERIGAYFAGRMKMNYRVPEGEGNAGGGTQEWDLGIGRSPLFAMDQASDTGSRVVRLIVIVVLVAVGLLVLYFLVRPLFSRETRASLRGAHPLRFLAAKVRAIVAAFREAALAIRRGLRAPRKTVLRVARTLFEGLQGAARQAQEGGGRDSVAARQRRQRLARTLREFLRIIRWGEQAGVPFRPSMGPLEYATSLGRAVADRQEDLLEAARAFEEIVFSHHELEERRVGEFYRKVDGIVRQGARRR